MYGCDGPRPTLGTDGGPCLSSDGGPPTGFGGPDLTYPSVVVPPVAGSTPSPTALDL